MIRKYLYGGPGYFLGGVTAKDLDEGTKKVAKGFNWLMGKVGDAFNTVVTAGASSDFGQTSPFALMDRKAVAKGREQVRQKAKKAIEENAVYVSPSSHVAAWTQGSLDPKVGALFLASDPRLQALGAVGDLAALKYTPKAVKVGKNLLLILKKRSAISKVNKELKKGIKENSVLESYNEVPANKDIGTAYDYLDFLDNIYPNSKLNATFYHGGPKGITQFKTAKELGNTNKGINSGTKDYGIYLADDKSLALYYAGTNKKANRHLYNVRVNVQNPMRYETNNWYMDKMSTTGDLRFRPGEITLKWYDKLGLKDYDGIYHTKSKNVFDNGELVMLDGNNIHIMGTPEESLMFRNWKLNPLYSSKPLLEEIPLTPEQYERSFLNYAKASKPGLFFAGLAATPPTLIWYDNYLKSKTANARKWKHLQGGKFRKFQIGGYIQPSNVLEAINNGSAAGGLLKGFGKVMSKILPEWMLKAGTYMSPLNYAAALSKGSINPKVGEEVISKWHPNILLAARLGEAVFGGKAIKNTPKAIVNTAAKAGVKPAKAAVIAREINKGVKQNTKNGRIEVTNTYFNSPDKWYRITETPEKYGIMELGKNVTTHDASQTHGTINGWRSSMLKAPITKSSEGFIKRPQKIELGIRRKNGQAHGNTSQAAKGKLWGGTTSGSNLFPEGIIEGQAPSMINYGIDRTNFVMTPWELVPNGGRVGFHTGEMPMSNLGWFQRTNKGTYTYEPIIPEKRISYQPKLLLDSPTSLKFFEKKPSKLDWSLKVGLPKEVRNRKIPQYTLENARLEALLFAKKWGYELPENASLLLIEELYNLHNTLFRGVTTEGLNNTRETVANNLGIKPEQLTTLQYLEYVSTHPWPGNDRIWVTPNYNYAGLYGVGNRSLNGMQGLVSAVMRPWKKTKDIKKWPQQAEWKLGFKEDVLDPIITPWVSNDLNAIRSTGALSELLIKSPLIYRGLGLDFKGTLLLQLKYNDGQGKLGWIEQQVGNPPEEIYINFKKGGKLVLVPRK